jgi:hypothetical protein
MSHDLLKLHIQMNTQDIDAAESLWDHLVGWCDEHHFFLGGKAESALIYSPVQLIDPTQVQQLSDFLNARGDINVFWLKFVELESLYRLTLKTAAIEAFSQAQRFLAEQMGECADALAGLTFTLTNHWSASVSEKGKILVLRNTASQLRLTLSHVNGVAMPVFDEYGGESFGLERLEELIPDWLGLGWHQEVAGGAMKAGKWESIHGDWQVTLYAEPGSGLTHRSVMLRYMQVCAS